MWLITAAMAVLGSLVSLWATLRYIILVDIRLDMNTFNAVCDLISQDNTLIITEEVFPEGRLPRQMHAFCWLPDCPPFYLSHIGTNSDQNICSPGNNTTVVTCCRWHYKPIKDYLYKCANEKGKEASVPVTTVMAWGLNRIGRITFANPPLLPESVWKDIDDEIAEVVAGKRRKTGAILYGPPGNGKTSFIKYMALKHNLSVKVMVFSPQHDNSTIMGMFGQITPGSLVLFEDFDNYFDGRQCIIGQGKDGSSNNEISFTFDAFLNSLDGVYNSYDGAVFMMTVNDIDKVDIALKHRPSRFKYVRKFDNPCIKMREALVSDWADPTIGLNLDQLLRVKEYKEVGYNLADALSAVNHECGGNNGDNIQSPRQEPSTPPKCADVPVQVVG